LEEKFQQRLAAIIRSIRLAALGTIHDGAPMVSMVPYGAAEDFTCFYLLTSELAPHTQDMHKERNVSLLICETDDDRDDPLTLARVVIRGQAGRLPMGEPGYMPAKDLYIGRFPRSAPLFEFGDFGLWRITVKGGRFVAGFGKAFNLTADAIRAAAIASAQEGRPGPNTGGG
jgi:hypothetical protein